MFKYTVYNSAHWKLSVGNNDLISPLDVLVQSVSCEHIVVTSEICVGIVLILYYYTDWLSYDVVSVYVRKSFKNYASCVSLY